MNKDDVVKQQYWRGVANRLRRLAGRFLAPVRRRWLRIHGQQQSSSSSSKQASLTKYTRQDPFFLSPSIPIPFHPSILLFGSCYYSRKGKELRPETRFRDYLVYVENADEPKRERIYKTERSSTPTGCCLHRTKWPLILGEMSANVGQCRRRTTTTYYSRHSVKMCVCARHS